MATVALTKDTFTDTVDMDEVRAKIATEVTA